MIKKENMRMEQFKGYYKKNREERIKVLEDILSKEAFDILKENRILSNEVASKMVENQLSVFGLPYGIATNFLINGRDYLIPMCIEEPSVIAAASNAAKIMRENGGIKVHIKERIMIGQIAYYNIKKDPNVILENKQEILKLANMSHDGIVSIGGGAKDISIEKKGEFLIVYLYVDTKDAMGANIINTMLESIDMYIKELVLGQKLMSILSNYSTGALVKASCRLKLDLDLSKKIELACKFANVDIYRATTNNKGIFNGIDALAIATGNDFRAIEAGAHAYASRTGKYSSLTNWYLEGEYLVGELEIPMPIASVGGSIGVNPLTKVSMELLNNPDAKTLSMVAVALGLAQNFAALRALVSVGIQKGHMKLHANTVAVLAGAKEQEIPILIKKMQEISKIEISIAKKILEEMRNESNS